MSQSDSFLCGRCRNILCPDCKSIADEYAELLQRRNQALNKAERRVEELERTLNDTERKAALWEQMSKVGLPEVIQKWMDDQIAKQAR